MQFYRLLSHKMFGHLDELVTTLFAIALFERKKKIIMFVSK